MKTPSNFTGEGQHSTFFSLLLQTPPPISKKTHSVVFMPTFLKDALVPVGSDKKPVIIRDYNINRGNKLTVCHLHLTRKWPAGVSQHFRCVCTQCICLMGSHPLRKKKHRQTNEWRVLLMAPGSSLIKPYCTLSKRSGCPETQPLQKAAELMYCSTLSTASATQSTSEAASSSASPASASTSTATTPLRPPSAERKRCQACRSNKDRKTNTFCCCCKNIRMHLNAHVHMHVFARRLSFGNEYLISFGLIFLSL